MHKLGGRLRAELVPCAVDTSLVEVDELLDHVRRTYNNGHGREIDSASER
jgi:hypothetical protein